MSAVTDVPWIAIVPARAGSVGVPGKNRRTIQGQTLAELAMERAELITTDASRVYVTTDDPIIESLAAYRGHTIIARPTHLAGPEATIVDVVQDVMTYVRPGDVGPSPRVAVCQPTSPNLSMDTVLSALDAFYEHPEWDSLATVCEEPHMMWWERSDGSVTTVFEERVNRQYRRDHVYKETGALMLVREWTSPGSLITDSHHLFPIPVDESTDVDTPFDLLLAAAHASTRTLEWRIIAGQSVGYGHLYRALALAAELPHHQHRFVVDGPVEALVTVRERYPAIHYGEYYESSADVVIFDCLTIEQADYQRAKDEGSTVIGIELTEIPENAWLDLYVNELATTDSLAARAAISRVGADYASLRDEFQIARRAVEQGWADRYRHPGRVLITFGGEDPARMTEQSLEALVKQHDVRAIIGPGFNHDYAVRLRRTYGDHLIESHQARMADEMLKADVVVTSAGRTAWEAASLGNSIVTIPVNERERDHAWPTLARRVPHYAADNATIRFLVEASLMDEHDGDARRERALASRADGRGAQRFAWLMDGLIRGVL
jgi:spore coat polysaccharide biosynthesis predicted glycosyltransferase SpsG/CMP-N-acetylneuraminic acid synthetase